MRAEPLDASGSSSPIHGYAAVDGAIVLDVATTRLAGLIEVLDDLLQAASDAESPYCLKASAPAAPG